ncbi:MAG: HAMP domain-containing sensor histidine kinase [Patescibacteria group bacterium]
MSLIYGLPLSVIPIICFTSISYIGIKFIFLNLKVKNLEYEFTSIVNHTFRTPLTRIMWLLKELERDMPQSEKMLYLQNITNASNKILDIVDLVAGIKNLNNTSSYFFEAMSIRDVVEKSIVKYREEINKKNLKFQVSTFKDIPLLTLDIKKITFVIDALIENAIFYTPKNGEVGVDSIMRDNKITLFVGDTGVGLTMVDKMRIFSRFYRNKKAVLMNPDGMGIKLYLSRQIIRRHDGRMYAKSKGIDKGTTFFVELPLKKA